jgi:hypothetical protein
LALELRADMTPWRVRQQSAATAPALSDQHWPAVMACCRNGPHRPVCTSFASRGSDRSRCRQRAPGAGAGRCPWCNRRSLHPQGPERHCAVDLLGFQGRTYRRAERLPAHGCSRRVARICRNAVAEHALPTGQTVITGRCSALGAALSLARLSLGASARGDRRPRRVLGTCLRWRTSAATRS